MNLSGLDLITDNHSKQNGVAMLVEYLNRINISIQIVVVMGMIVRSISLVRKSSRPMLAAYFTFGCISFVMSDMYWLAYSFINPGKRMPFAANEFGEAAGFLLYGSALYSIAKKDRPFWREDFLLPLLIMAGYMALWIGWSGEWLEDILTGAVFGYYLCRCCRALREEKALSRAEQTGLGALTILIPALEGLIFFVPEKAAAVLDTVCYLMMSVILVCFLLLNIRELRRRGQAGRRMALAFSLFAWAGSCMYMSAGIWYNLFYFFAAVSTVLMLGAVQEEVRNP